MKTTIRKIDRTADLDLQLCDAAEMIRNGGLVVFPTETVYGLGGSALDAEAAGRIYSAKGRPSDNPLIIHISDPSEAEKYCYTNPTYYRLAEAFMPGPLTVIMPKRDCIPLSVTGGLDTVAVRCPEDIVARTLIRLSGVPIAAPSANISGRPSPTSAEHVIDDLNGRVDMILDGGDCRIGLESTVVKADGDSVTVLRPGGITPQMLSEVCGEVSLDGGITKKSETGTAPLAPGMKYKHYAPRPEVYLLTGNKARIVEYIRSELAGNDDVGVIAFDEYLPDVAGRFTVGIGSEADYTAHAHSLFSALRYFDTTSVVRIYARAVEARGIDLATYNRMIKAAGYKIIDFGE